MGFIDAIYSGFSNYFKFSGRAVRSEFWYWVLFTVLAGIVLSIFDLIMFGINTTPGAQQFTPVTWAFQVITLIPGLAVGVRRLHDTGRSGWWLLLGVAAYSGPLAIRFLHWSGTGYLAYLTLVAVVPLIVWYCFDGDYEENEYGINIFIERRRAEEASI